LVTRDLPGGHRLGFMVGAMQMPGDFDHMAAGEIARTFNGGGT